MIANINARKLSDGSIFVQWNRDGKALDGAFADWTAFAKWLREQVEG